MGSERDLEFCQKIAKTLKVLGVEFVYRVASAHKTPLKVLEIIEEFKAQKVVYITVAGRSNALSAFVDANSSKLVVACPPYSEKFSGADIYSSLRVPSGIGCVVTIEPEGAAIAAAKVFALQDAELEKRIQEYQREKQQAIEKADQTIKNMK
ncbi:MAG: AIR carboxylase family protein [Candidatus Bathyarchaeota archaeon]|nr:AIR carboxylase family protein [Candidatus Bathyarchaeota archaeon]